MTLCGACGFDWHLPPEHAMEAIRTLPSSAVLALLTTDVATSHRTDQWSAGAYVWHLADVLRISAERFYGVGLDPSIPVVPFDQDELAAARRYELQRTDVAVRSLTWSVEEWLRVAATLDPDLPYLHPEFGELTVSDGFRLVAHEVHHHLRDIELALGPGSIGRSG